ncbi:GNAT family N-acetyltransferase [Couchioplanes caeruleus]|uniref:GNAT family N-acetyltransferase n=2 Tax=Couchioplanes caeruleus TaxID=56438 RepID=A0A1K0GE27_9ACTN|nr:GNAT family N-acetyltransferase [Couchioplanes caeruleus]OJF15490.1 GNAT family N-acetyltransferase [Couchioplanes caeruleus subsp. caeruleus]ROP27535.1 RimJ/RimL family protein N-acetyltransferase [Couchioplanes caeruleus]
MEDDGLTLRPWRDSDAAALIAVATDPELRRWTSLRVSDEATAAAWLRIQHHGWETGTRYAFAVLDDRRLLGHAVLKQPGAEVGYWTAAAARGQGVASRALKILTGWAFAEFPELPRLRLLHQVGNAGSCRVALKTGYAYEQTYAAEHPFPYEGHLHLRSR